MSSSVGRGRGWLNLKAHQSAKTPGSDNSEENVNSEDNGTFSDAPNDYTGLINKIKMLSVSDDGIKLNQKIKYIVEEWSKDCKNAEEVEKSLNILHEASLLDPEVATKLALLIASRTFLLQEIHTKNIRVMFLRKLQDNFEGCAQLQKRDPSAFRNSIQLMGDFYNKARFSNGRQFTFMASPLLSCLDMLLESGELLDLKLFVAQLYLNGTSIKQECPEQMAEVLSKIRIKICSDAGHIKEPTFWLLLALELANHRFSLLPTEIQKFYQEQLGDCVVALFQGSYGALTVQTIQSSKKLDSFQSNVNVLQISAADSALDTSLSMDSISEQGLSLNCCSSGVQNDSAQDLVVNNIEMNSNPERGSKPGRPILGIGARLQRSHLETEITDNAEIEKFQREFTANAWNRNKQGQNRTKTSNDTGNWQKTKNHKEISNNDGNWRARESKKGSDQANLKKKNCTKSKKGWEHDDRFETNYN